MKKPWYARWWGVAALIVLALVLALAVALGMAVWRNYRLLQAQGPGAIAPSQAGPGSLDAATLARLVPDTAPRIGPADPQVVVVEFVDFQCPFCGQMAPVVSELIRRYGDRVLFAFRDLPITSIHDRALPAALAARCAQEQGAYKPYHDKIFANQSDLSEAAFKRYAVQLGLNSFQFNGCFESQKYLPMIETDLNEALALGAVSTPTFFVNGQLLDGAVPLAQFEQIIVAALNAGR